MAQEAVSVLSWKVPRERGAMRRVFNVLPSIVCFLWTCWEHHHHEGDWLFGMLASIFLLQYYAYIDKRNV
jgi:hypothetical protein